MDIIEFVKTYYPNLKLTEYQERMLKSFAKDGKLERSIIIRNSHRFGSVTLAKVLKDYEDRRLEISRSEKPDGTL